MDQEEDATIVVVLLGEAFDWAVVLGTMGVCPVCLRVFDSSEVGTFVIYYL